MDWFIGFAGSLLIAGGAYRLKSLAFSGFVAAVIMGTLIYGIGGFLWAGTLIAFFMSSSLLSQYKKRAKAATEQLYEKSGRRDAGQVLANGGLGLLLCILSAFFPYEGFLLLFVGAIATVTADTWATEIGGLSGGQPRFILNGRKVPKGTSGAVSPAGTAASLAGGLFIGAVTALLGGADGALAWPALIALAGLAGMGGALADSALGATVQAMYACTVCGRELERTHHCGQAAVLVRGSARMNNDAVNFISSAAGAGLAACLAAVWSCLG
ncbi:membrane protein [Paenibacillus swuensis]|uniref:Membrane protein n=1 Tax=Paenibacillus swuensis TaxID=1178515 RepID=A0A172TMP0_9BACL|nr:DUF92 domain-containing protein [Paenibacillus swuensis]ANE48311.1 membrane protein [Paenibacillus swuensis]